MKSGSPLSSLFLHPSSGEAGLGLLADNATHTRVGGRRRPGVTKGLGGVLEPATMRTGSRAGEAGRKRTDCKGMRISAYLAEWQAWLTLCFLVVVLAVGKGRVTEIGRSCYCKYVLTSRKWVIPYQAFVLDYKEYQFTRLDKAAELS